MKIDRQGQSCVAPETAGWIRSCVLAEELCKGACVLPAPQHLLYEVVRDYLLASAQESELPIESWHLAAEQFFRGLGVGDIHLEAALQFIARAKLI